MPLLLSFIQNVHLASLLAAVVMLWAFWLAYRRYEKEVGVEEQLTQLCNQ